MPGVAAAEALSMVAAVRDNPARRLVRLLGFVQDGLPAYAWTNDEDHPWTNDQVSRPQVDPDLADLVLRIRLSA